MNRYGDEEFKLQYYADDILKSEGMQYSKSNRHHGEVSVYSHSVDVAIISLKLARKLKLKVDEKSLVRGALLHDYYLYDWHEPDESHRLHGFSHAKTAYNNASDVFDLNHIEKDIIIKHMFPLNLPLPMYRESVLVCIADKISAIKDYSKQMTWVREHKEALQKYIRNQDISA